MNNLTVHTITAEVASYYRVNVNEIYSIRRHGNLIKYKHIAIYFIRHYLNLSLADTGRVFPGKKGYLDHATIINAVKSVQNQYESNKLYRKEIDEIRLRFEAMAEDQRADLEEVFMEPDYFTN